MKTFLWGAAVSAGLLALVSCGEQAPAAPAADPVPAPVAAPPAKPKVAATVIDATLFNHFLIVPDSGDTGTILADGAAYEIRSKGVDRVAAGDGDGVLVRVPAETAAQLGGRKVKVTITARTSPTNGSPSFKAMYYRPGSEGGSGWQDFTLTAEFAPYSFEYAVPEAPSSSGVDNIGFWADTEGKGRGLEIAAVAVETVD
jgi:hypothetical protein